MTSLWYGAFKHPRPFVQDEDAAVVVTTEKPFVAILAVVDLALVIGHLASAETIYRAPDSFRAIQSFPPAGPQDSFSARPAA
jgi:hypothetical protein